MSQIKIPLNLDSKTKKAFERLSSEDFCILIENWLQCPHLSTLGTVGNQRTIVNLENELYSRIRVSLIGLGVRDPYAGLSQLINGLLVSKKSEKAYQIELAKTVPFSQMEVVCPIGRIDIISPQVLIECKHYGNVNAFKHALGQVLSYGYYYPNLALKLALIGKPRGQELVEVQKVCAHFSVELIWL